mmetsp:Transcript_7178/g.12935  ORF Transcript_7178/g.12935 Transcript_7178/m.12935 type:complete len:152 (-) Transcript_7178:192-647(-)
MMNTKTRELLDGGGVADSGLLRTRRVCVRSFTGVGVGYGMFGIGIGIGLGYGVGIGFGQNTPYKIPVINFGPTIGSFIGFGIGFGRINGVNYRDDGIDWMEVFMGAKSWGMTKSKKIKNSDSSAFVNLDLEFNGMKRIKDRRRRKLLSILG